MPFENIIFAITCWLCSLIFGGIAIWAYMRKDPMHFWSGSTVKTEEITDIRSYNRANAIMWAIYTLCMVAAGIISLFSIKIGAILLVIICVPGIFVLVIVYNWIYKRYKNKSYKKTADKPASRMSKLNMTVIVLISAITVCIVAILFFYGEKEPEVNILENSIQIKAMYGLTIDFSDIDEISLINKSLSDIGIGRRTNGYGGIGGTLKGNFKSETLGDVLLFVHINSSPTIKIDRSKKKDIYINYKDSKMTETLYSELTAKISQE